MPKPKRSQERLKHRCLASATYVSNENLDVDLAVDLLRKPKRREALRSVVHFASQQNDRP